MLASFETLKPAPPRYPQPRSTNPLPTSPLLICLPRFGSHLSGGTNPDFPSYATSCREQFLAGLLPRN